MPQLDYLGFSLGWGTWRPDDKRVHAVTQMQVRNLVDLRRFLGALNFVRRHIFAEKEGKIYLDGAAPAEARRAEAQAR